MDEYLQPGRFIDSDRPEVIAFAERNRGANADLREQAVSLYYAVRDQVVLVVLADSLRLSCIYPRTPLSRDSLLFGACTLCILLCPSGS